MTKAKYRLSVTLADGTVHAFEVAKMPRAWGSWLMQQCPYGTDFFGCQMDCERIVATGQVA